MKRYLENKIKKDLGKKIILLSGPRQCGKTTLSKMLDPDFDYLDYDYAEHRLIIDEKGWDRKRSLLILDEIHKKNNWKSFLKGIYDVEGLKPPIIVTGSARLDTIRKTGDSLAGRYFHFRLHPFDIKELKNLDFEKPEKILDRLKKFGSFPEPFLEGSESFYRRWQKTHIDIILRQDLIDLEPVRSINQIETLIELLKNRVGSPVSYSSLAEDIECSPKSIKNWLQILENLYMVFPVRPYHKNIGRAILKEPKYYFYDPGLIKRSIGAQIENIAACALLKELHFVEDVYGLETSINYIKNKQGKEIDFYIRVEDKQFLIEVKSNDDSLSSNFKIFDRYLPKAKKIQLVDEIKKEKTYPDKTEIRRLSSWLADLDLSPSNV
jgi:uncharacterized protein